MTTNGCGPEWAPPVAPQAFPEACREHDGDYAVGGTEADREAADAEFLERMQIEAYRRPWYVRPFYQCLAGLYYTAVRLGGWASFRYRRK